MGEARGQCWKLGWRAAGVACNAISGVPQLTPQGGLKMERFPEYSTARTELSVQSLGREDFRMERSLHPEAGADAGVGQ